MPGSSIPTPTSAAAGGRRRSLTCQGRQAVQSTRTPVPTRVAGPWPHGHRSGYTACLSLTPGPGCGMKGQLLPVPPILGTPCKVSVPPPVSWARKDHLALCSPCPLGSWQGLIRGQDPYVNLPGFSDHHWTKEVLGLGCTFCTRPSLCRVGEFYRTATQD